MIDLRLGDCANVLKDISSESVDLTITSPPYDDLRTYEDSINQWSFSTFKEVANELYRVTKDGGVVVWVVGDSTIEGSESCTSFKQALYFRDIGFNLHDTMIWNKNSFTFPSNERYHQVFEYMFVFSKGKPKTTNFIKDRKNLYLGDRGASGRDKDGNRASGKSSVREPYGKRYNIWTIPIGKGNSSKDDIAYEHPAIFPEQLAGDHILTWSNEGDTVLDCFMGSGTVGKMAYLLDRDFIGIEKVQKYFDIAKSRIERYTLKNKLF